MLFKDLMAFHPGELLAIEHSVKPHPTPTQIGNLCGNIAMFDGIALEAKCCYCPQQDQIIGLCCEHSCNVNTKVDSMESVDKVQIALFDLKDEDLLWQ